MKTVTAMTSIPGRPGLVGEFGPDLMCGLCDEETTCVVVIGLGDERTGVCRACLKAALSLLPVEEDPCP